MFVIMGATGNTGKIAATALLDAGQPVRVIGRDAAKLAPFTSRGADAAIGDAADVAFLTAAFTGATGVYVMVPPDYSHGEYVARYAALAQVAATALGNAKVTRAVFLSSLGAQHEAGTGPVKGLHRAEQALSKVSGLSLLLLRPGYFLENAYGNLGLIKHQGINGGAIKPDVPVDMTATRDIGLAAARALQDGDWTGIAVREVLSPRAVTMRELTSLLGSAIGKPDLAYVHFPDADFAGALVGAGFAAPVAEGFVEMSHALNDGRMSASQRNAGAYLGTGTAEQFAQEFAAVYGQ